MGVGYDGVGASTHGYKMVGEGMVLVYHGPLVFACALKVCWPFSSVWG